MEFICIRTVLFSVLFLNTSVEDNEVEIDYVRTKPVKNDMDENDDSESHEDQKVKEKIQREKEKLKELRKEEGERKRQEEKERLLQMRPTKHKETAGGGEPADEQTKERRNTVRKV